jgi:hypothetical protein
MAQNKLNARGKELIISLLIQGKSNDQVNGALVDNGFKSLSLQSLSEYRNSPQIKQAQQEAIEEIRQVGYAALQNRLRAYEAHFAALVTKLSIGTTPFINEDGDEVQKPLSPHQQAVLTAAMIATGKEISRLTDTVSEKSGEVQQPVPAPTLTPGQISNIRNDAVIEYKQCLVKYLAEKQQRQLEAAQVIDIQAEAP